MDQLGGSGEYPDGASRGEGSMRHRVAASEMGGASAGGRGAARRGHGDRTGVARIPGENVRALAVAGCVRVCGRNSAHECGQVQEDRAPRAVRGMEVESIGLCGPLREEAGPPIKSYITPTGLQRLKDEHVFLLSRERPAVADVVAWAASNGDRGENADYR